MINDDISLSIIVVDPFIITHRPRGSDLGFFLLHREAKIQTTSCAWISGEERHVLQRERRRRAPRLPQSLPKFSHGIVQHTDELVKCAVEQANTPTARQCPVDFSQTRLWMRPLTSASLRSGKEKASAERA